MSLGAIGAALAVLVAVFIVGHIWFHIVEGVLDGLKRLFGKNGPAVWHTLLQEQEKGENEHD